MEGIVKMEEVEPLPLELDIDDESTDEEEEDYDEAPRKLPVKDLPKTIPEAKALLKKEEGKADACLDKMEYWKNKKGFEMALHANPYLKYLRPSFNVHSGNAKILKRQLDMLEGTAEKLTQELSDLNREEKEIQDSFERKRMKLDAGHEKTQEKLQTKSDKLQQTLKAVKNDKKFDRSNQENGRRRLEAAFSVKQAKVEENYAKCAAKLDMITGVPVAASDSESS
jgi:chromosome segregation ATPase